MVDFVPSTESVRVAYAVIDGSVSNDIYDARRAAFDRWLDAVKADAAADARLGYICGRCWIADGKHEPGIHSQDSIPA